MLDVVADTIIDVLKLIPFLFLAYLFMEYLEHKTSGKVKNIVEKSGKTGPLWGAILGIFPQCGFSAAAADLYAGRVITLGTLIAVFLSTSDEMLPILISEMAPIDVIVKVLLIKLLLGIIFGFIIDIFYQKFIKNKKSEDTSKTIEHICDHEHCDCEHDGIFIAAVKHTINIIVFIPAFTFILNIAVYFIGEDNIKNLVLNIPVVGILISGLIGLIPNCAGSVLITELYLSNLISFGYMIAGLAVCSGIGILVLFRTNKSLKQNLAITGILYTIGIFAGIIIDIIF